MAQINFTDLEYLILISCLVIPLGAILTSLIYYEQRTRKEGGIYNL